MIVGLIHNAIDDLWTERFPQDHSVDFPKGLIKELGEVWPEEDDMTDREYERRVEIQWFDQDTDNFETKKESIITSMLGLTSNSEVDKVRYLGATVGYSPIEDRMVLSMEFMIEHRI